MSAHEVRELEALKQEVAALKRALSSPTHMVQSMQSGVGYNYMEPPPQQWRHTYHPYDRNHHDLNWTNPIGGTDAPGYLPQPPYQAPRVEPPPQQAPRLKSMVELYKEHYGYDYVPPTDEERMQRSSHIYQNHPHCHSVPIRSYSDVGAYVPSSSTLQQHQAQRSAPPPPQAHQNSDVMNMIAEIGEKLDMVATNLSGVKAKVEARGIALQALKLREPAREQVEAIVIQSGNAPTDPPSPSHERVEATEATETEEREEIPEELVVIAMERDEDIPLTLDQPLLAMGMASDDGAEDALTTHIHEEDITVNVIPSRDTPTDFAHDSSVEVCSRKDSDALVEQVVHEIEILSGVEKAQVQGMRQERKAAKQQKLEEIKSGPSSRCKDRQAEMKGAMAASKKMKPSTPRNTTKVKMKAKRGVGKNKGPRQEGKKTGHGVPKMAYLKYIGRKDQFPPPFIP